jgi:hypothetical protein
MDNGYDKICVIIRTNKGNYTLNVDKFSTVKELKDLIEAHDGVPSNVMNLVFNNRSFSEYHESKMLYELGIVQYSEINIFFKLYGD